MRDVRLDLIHFEYFDKRRAIAVFGDRKDENLGPRESGIQLAEDREDTHRDTLNGIKNNDPCTRYTSPGKNSFVALYIAVTPISAMTGTRRSQADVREKMTATSCDSSSRERWDRIAVSPTTKGSPTIGAARTSTLS